MSDTSTERVAFEAEEADGPALPLIAVGILFFCAALCLAQFIDLSF